MKISVILPSYLEAENLRDILPALKNALEGIDYEILVLDTMEPLDETETVCNINGAKYIARRGGNNYGDAIRTGFADAVGDYIVVMDADGSHDPKCIPEFLKEMESKEYDLIIGSRYCKGGHTENPAILRLMSWMLNVTYRLLFDLRVKDVSDSFRMYKREQIKTLQLECDNFDLVEEILIKLSLYCKTFRVKEIPISFYKRAAGESKRDLVKFIFSYCVTIHRLLKIKHKTEKSIREARHNEYEK